MKRWNNSLDIVMGIAYILAWLAFFIGAGGAK